MIDDPDYSTSTIRLLVFQALKQWDTKALFNLLFDDDCIVRTAAARELQTRGDIEIFQNLKKHLEDPRTRVREICAFTMGQLGTPDMPYREESEALLIKLLKDNDAEVRAAAVSALGHLFSREMPESVESELISMIDDVAGVVRECLAFALGNSSGSKDAMSALNRLRHDSCKEVRSWAETGLEMLEDKKG